jgi:uncharacterized membrane protein
VDRSRLESFSDGVLAVAITVLVFNLAVPHVTGQRSILGELGDHWPSFLAYLISFFTIGIVWVNHHWLVQNIRVVNRSLLFINLLLLAVVVTIPFATAMMADYLTKPGQNAKIAAALYALDFELMSLGFTGLFEWTLREGERLHRPVPEAAKWSARRRFYAGQLPYLAAIGVAFASPYASLAITGAVALYYVFEHPPREPIPEPGDPEGAAIGRQTGRTPPLDNS